MPGFSETYVLHANRALANSAKVGSAYAAFDSPEGGVRACLGTQHATALDLAVSQWQLWGDGRALVGDMHRLIEVYRLLEPHGLQSSVGTARQVASFIKRHLASLEEVAFDAPALTEKEKAVCSLAAEYSRFLEASQLVELCQALPAIRDQVARLDVRAAGPLLLDEPLAGFYEGLFGEGFDRTDAGCCGDDAKGLPDFVLLEPEGASAVGKMVFDEAKASMAERGMSTVAIASPRPLDDYMAMAPALREAGAVCAFEASVPFQQTSFGRFFVSGCKLLAMAGLFGVGDVLEVTDENWIDVATDVALSPYAGIAPFDSSLLPSLRGDGRAHAMGREDMNSVWRANRLLDAEDAVSDLSAMSAAFQGFQVLFSLEGDPFAVLERFRADARRLHRGHRAMVEEAAVDAAKDLLRAASDLRCPTSYMALFPACASLRVSAVDDGDEDRGGQEGSSPFVMFVPIDGPARMAPGSFDEVIACDVTDAYLNAREDAESTDGLAGQLGLRRPRRRMERSRAVFSASERAAAGRFVCVLPLRDVESQESFASFAFDEFLERRFGGQLDASQAKAAARGAMPEGVPSDLAPFLESNIFGLGEEHLVQGVGLQLSAPSTLVTLPKAERGRLTHLKLPDFMLCGRVGGRSLVSMSASAMEAYLDCPYKWFVERVVNPRRLDEEFGPLEAGNFAHELLERLYRGLASRFDAGRLRDVSPEEAYESFREASSVASREQYASAPNEGRYVAATGVEALAAQRLVSCVWRSALLHRALPEDMRVAGMEYAIGQEDDGAPAAEYAGFALRGKVDRIDVSEDGGTFAVIDYKGSIAGHAAGDDCMSFAPTDEGRDIDPSSLPRHVQALVYAQALRRLGPFGDRCRGALYTSYRADSASGLVTGSYPADDKALAAVSDSKSAVHMDFGDFLDMVEKAVASRLDGVRGSSIPVEPSCADACRHCSLSFCERGRKCR